MTSTKNVQNTHISGKLRELHGALIEIVSVMNRPQRDERWSARQGSRSIVPCFRCWSRSNGSGPIGVVELADRAGRDYTTVSRQVAKLESLDLVERRGNAADRRVREAVISPKGKAMTDRIDVARERMGRAIFESWDEHDFNELVRLMRKFAEDISGDIGNGAGETEGEGGPQAD